MCLSPPTSKIDDFYRHNGRDWGALTTYQQHGLKFGNFDVHHPKKLYTWGTTVDHEMVIWLWVESPGLFSLLFFNKSPGFMDVHPMGIEALIRDQWLPSVWAPPRVKCPAMASHAMSSDL